MPTVFTERLIYLDDFLAMLAKSCPPDDIRQDRHVQSKLAGRLSVVDFHQAPTERLVGNLGFAAKESIDRNFIGTVANFAGKAQPLIVLVDPFVQRVSQAETVARFKLAR